MPRGAGSPRRGLFAPEQIFWRVNREAVLLLTGPRALLLQLAHPLVAAGVAEHSRFQQEPLARLRRTLDTMLTIIYGERAAAEAAAAAVNAAHRRVRGELADETAAFPAGTRYDASDPELARWVHATLVDSALVGFECFVRELDADERARFVRESNAVGALFGIPEALAFRDAADFDAYVRRMIHGEQLEVSPTGARLADAVLHPPIPLLPRFAGDIASLASVALLPPALRERYRLAWGTGREHAWRALRGGIRSALPHLPALARIMPHARRAERALARRSA